MNIYEVEFKGMYNDRVPSCLFIQANDKTEADKIALATLEPDFGKDVIFTVHEFESKESGVIIYLSGDY